MVSYSHLLKNFPQFAVIHIVRGFGVVNKAEVDVFLELSCFSYYPLYKAESEDPPNSEGTPSPVSCPSPILIRSSAGQSRCLVSTPGRQIIFIYLLVRFACVSDSKESAYSAGDLFKCWVRKIPWRRAWQPTPVFLPEESHGQRSLAGHGITKELDMTEVTEHA